MKNFTLVSLFIKSNYNSPVFNNMRRLYIKDSIFFGSFRSIIKNSYNVSIYNSKFRSILDSAVSINKDSCAYYGYYSSKSRPLPDQTTIDATSCFFDGCSASEGSKGGAIEVYVSSSTLSCTNCFFYNCYTITGEGGGIYFSGSSLYIQSVCASRCISYSSGQFLYSSTQETSPINILLVTTAECSPIYNEGRDSSIYIDGGILEGFKQVNISFGSVNKDISALRVWCQTGSISECMLQGNIGESLFYVGTLKDTYTLTLQRVSCTNNSYFSPLTYYCSIINSVSITECYFPDTYLQFANVISDGTITVQKSYFVTEPQQSEITFSDNIVSDSFTIKNYDFINTAACEYVAGDITIYVNTTSDEVSYTETPDSKLSNISGSTIAAVILGIVLCVLIIAIVVFFCLCFDVPTQLKSIETLTLTHDELQALLEKQEKSEGNRKREGAGSPPKPQSSAANLTPVPKEKLFESPKRQTPERHSGHYESPREGKYKVNGRNDSQLGGSLLNENIPAFETTATTTVTTEDNPQSSDKNHARRKRRMTNTQSPDRGEGKQGETSYDENHNDKGPLVVDPAHRKEGNALDKGASQPRDKSIPVTTIKDEEEPKKKKRKRRHKKDRGDDHPELDDIENVSESE